MIAAPIPILRPPPPVADRNPLSLVKSYRSLTSVNPLSKDFAMSELGNGSATSAKKIWVTLSGLPLTIELKWPFHQSTSGADFWVLHGDIRLEGSEGLHAPD